MLDHGKNSSRLKVLRAISQGSAARSDLPQMTGLSGGRITHLTSDLLKREVIVERKVHSGRAGRPRVELNINPNSSVILSANLAESEIVSGMFVDPIGRSIAHTSCECSRVNKLSELADQMAQAFEKMIVAGPVPRNKVTQVGLSLPAILDRKGGVVHFMATMEGAPYPFADHIADRLDIPVAIENSIACMARGEYWFGDASELENFTLIEVGATVSSARYLDGVARVGANGINQELGHVKTGLHNDAPICICGGRGCLATYCSVVGIVRASGIDIALEDYRSVSWPHVLEQFDRLKAKAHCGDNFTKGLFNRAAVHLGIAVANHLNANDPGTIMIKMEDAQFMSLIERRCMEVIRANTLPGINQMTKISFRPLLQDWRERGMAALALEALCG